MPQQILLSVHTFSFAHHLYLRVTSIYVVTGASATSLMVYTAFLCKQCITKIKALHICVNKTGPYKLNDEQDRVCEAGYSRAANRKPFESSRPRATPARLRHLRKSPPRCKYRQRTPCRPNTSANENLFDLFIFYSPTLPVNWPLHKYSIETFVCLFIILLTLITYLLHILGLSRTATSLWI